MILGPHMNSMCKINRHIQWFMVFHKFHENHDESSHQSIKFGLTGILDLSKEDKWLGL